MCNATMRYSTVPRGWAFVKGYGFLSFSKIMDKNVGKYSSGQYSQKCLDHTEQSAPDAL